MHCPDCLRGQGVANEKIIEPPPPERRFKPSYHTWVSPTEVTGILEKLEKDKTSSEKAEIHTINPKKLSSTTSVSNTITPKEAITKKPASKTKEQQQTTGPPKGDDPPDPTRESFDQYRSRMFVHSYTDFILALAWTEAGGSTATGGMLPPPSGS